MPNFQRMIGKGSELLRYDDYLAYIDAGELEGTLSYDEWLERQYQKDEAK